MAALCSTHPCWAETNVPPAMKDVYVKSNIRYSYVDDYEAKGDLYLKEDGSKALRPAVVVIHAGGWTSGSRSDYGCVEVSRQLAAAGIVAFDIDYRLVSDGGRWPHSAQDVWRAGDYLRKNAAKYRIDTNRMGVFGVSSGANLALMTAYTPETCELTDATPPLRMYKVAVAFSPPANLAKLRGAWLIDYLNDVPTDCPALTKKTSPVYYVKTAVPTLIVQGEKDPIVPPDQSKELYARLKAAGVDTELIMLPNADHFYINRGGAEYDSLVAKGIAFIQKHLQDATAVSPSAPAQSASATATAQGASPSAATAPVSQVAPAQSVKPASKPQ